MSSKGPVPGVLPSDAQMKQVTLILSNPKTLEAAAKAVFQRHDKNRDNVLELRECLGALAELQTTLGLPPVPQDVQSKLFRKFDKSRDNLLQFDEFLDMYQSLVRRIRDHFGAKLGQKVHVGKTFFIGKNSKSVLDCYDMGKKAGEGGFGVVCICTDKRSGVERVCKTINKEKTGMPVEEIEDEFKRLKEMDHPNILRIFEYFEDYNNIYLIMEPAKGGELFDVIDKVYYKQGGRLTEAWVAGVVKQMLEAIAYAHTNRIVHKDMKPQNVLLSASGQEAIPHVVVIDWGLAEMFNNDQARSNRVAGTPYYMSPEVFNQNFDARCDVWSVGVILFQLLTGYLPFEANSIEELQGKVCAFRADWGKTAGCSPEAVTLLRRMLCPEDRRYSASECLRDPWFRKAPSITKPMDPALLRKLHTYAERDHFQRTALQAIASQMNVNQLRGINDTFKKFDADANGVLDRKELALALRSLGLSDDLTAKAVDAMDMDGTGRVEYSEFVAACVSMSEGLLEDMLWSAFKKFDLNDDGTLTIDEVASVMSGGEMQTFFPGAETVQQIVSRISTDGDDKISFNEFKTYLMAKNKEGK